MGCADFVVFMPRDGSDFRRVLEIRGSRDELGLEAGAPAVFELPHPHLEVRVVDWSDRAESAYCNDVVGGQPDAVTTWTTVRGEARLEILEEGLELWPGNFDGFRMAFEIRDLVLVEPGGDRFRPGCARAGDLFLGWLPG